MKWFVNGYKEHILTCNAKTDWKDLTFKIWSPKTVTKRTVRSGIKIHCRTNSKQKYDNWIPNPSIINKQINK